MRQPLSSLAALVVAGMASAALADDVEQAAAGASQGVRAVVKRLAGRSFTGRDNDTPGSHRAQRLLISKLRRLGEGLRAGAEGEDAYRQPFVQSGVVGTRLPAVLRRRRLVGEDR